MLRAGWVGFLSLLLWSRAAAAEDPLSAPVPAPLPPTPLLPASAAGGSSAPVPAPGYAPPAPPRVVVRQEERSGVRKYFGMSFTGIGIAHMVIGSAVLGGFWTAGEFGPLAGLVIGGPILFDGSVMLAVGIPMWTTGAELIEVEVEADEEPSLAPSVQVGPTGASLGWSF